MTGWRAWDDRSREVADQIKRLLDELALLRPEDRDQLTVVRQSLEDVEDTGETDLGRLRRLGRDRARMIQAHRGPGGSAKRYARAWRVGRMPEKREPACLIDHAVDLYFMLSKGGSEFEDAIAMDATKREDAIWLRGTASELTTRLRSMVVNERNRVVSMVVTDAPCTPRERCGLIAAWTRRRNANSVASHLRSAKKAIERERDRLLREGASDHAGALTNLLAGLTRIPPGR